MGKALKIKIIINKYIVPERLKYFVLKTQTLFFLRIDLYLINEKTRLPEEKLTK